MAEEYDDTQFWRLMDAREKLLTSEEVARWEAEARLELNKLELALNIVNTDLAGARCQLSEAERANKYRVVLTRLLNGKSDIEAAQKAVIRFIECRARYEPMIERLRYWLSTVPTA